MYDLFEVGAIGLLDALDKFDLNKEVQLRPMLDGSSKRAIRLHEIVRGNLSMASRVITVLDFWNAHLMVAAF